MRPSAHYDTGSPAVNTRVTRFPASFGQERLWFLHQLNPATPVYNSSIVLEIKGTLDSKTLSSAIASLVERHETLRTTFDRELGDLAQAVHETLPPEFQVMNAGSRDDAMKSAKRFAERSFDLEHGPLARFGLIQAEADLQLLVASTHHTISDGWSLDVLWRDLSELYAAIKQDREPNLPELPIQYADFASWQRSSLTGERLENLLSHWKERLGGGDLPIDLPFDHPRPPALTYTGDSVAITLDKHVSAAVADLARESNATQFSVLVAAMVALIERYSGEQSISIGTPVAGRDRPEVKDLIGFFVNTVVLRVSPGKSMTFKELLSLTQKTALDAFEYQSIPFEKLVEELHPRREASHTPLFQVLVALQNYGRRKGPFGTLEAERVDFQESSVPFEITAEFEETDDGIEGSFGYSTDLFRRETAARMASHLESLINGALEDPQRPFRRIPIVSSDERELLSGWSAGPPPAPSEPAFAKVLGHARSSAPACEEADGSSLSYADLIARSWMVAGALAARGVGPEDAVAVLLPPGLDLVTAVLGIAGAGAVYVPVDRTNPGERIAHILSDCNARLVITAGGAHIYKDALDISEAVTGSPIAPSVMPPEGVAYTIYTSGSTGVPKGVMVPRSALDNLVSWHQRAFDARAGMRIGQVAGIGFDASVWEIWTTLASGGTLVFPPPETKANPAALRQWIADAKLDRCFMPTPIAERSLESHYWPQDTRIDILFTGGDQLVKRPDPTLEFQLVNCYGPTECAVISTIDRVQPADIGALPPIGSPIDGTRIYVLDSALETAPIGVTGEVYIAGNGLARGYTGLPRATAQSFVPDPHGPPGERMYRTGDVGRWLPDGRIEMHGRIDEQVKIRGLRVELGEIEAALAAYPAVQHAVVIARADATGNRRLLGYVTPSGLPIGAITEDLAKRLPSYMIPEAIQAITAMPLTPNGKVDKAALPDPARRTAAPSASMTPAQSKVAAAWSEVLGYEPDLNVKFFEAGGNSLKLVDLLERLQRDFPGVFKLADLFTLNTVTQMAQHAENVGRSAFML
ncbi:MAG TPA: amino acid adenylation domain-containing protein [Actinomycetota bacterium]|nr:amino acid adenylation domain-containing protein [Actinomycetota bacterium]